MLETKLLENRSAFPSHTHHHFQKLGHHKRVGIKNETNCLNLCFPCICKEKYHLTSVDKGFHTGNVLYIVEEEGCLCCRSFKVKDPETGDTVVGDWKQKNVCCCNPCGGPEMVVHGENDIYFGHSFKPCQLCNFGIDVSSSGDTKEFYIGTNFDCCKLLCAGCTCICDCFKCMFSCCNCNDRIFRYPIWDGEKARQIGSLFHVVTCLKVFVPCLGSKHTIIEYPHEINDIQKLRLAAGSLLFDRTLVLTKRDLFENENN